MKKAKILIVTESPIPHAGGMSTHILLLKENLINRGYEVEILEGTKLRSKWVKYRSIIKAGLTFKDVRKVWLGERIKILEKQIRDVSSNYDIIHCQDPIAAYAARKQKGKIVMTVHGPMLEHAKEHGRYNKAYLEYLAHIEKVSFDVSNQLIAVDTGQKDILINKLQPENKIKVIFNSVDVDRIINIAKGPKEELGDYFIMARRLVPKNGVVFAVKTFLEWVQEKNVSLILAGDGPLRKEIENLLLQHPQKDKIKLLGNVGNDRVLRLIKNSVCSLVPSIPVEGVIEATSLTALETLALDTTLIASNIGGLAEIDKGTNIVSLIEAGNKEDLIKAYEVAYTDREKGSLGAKERHVREYFGINQWIDKHLEVYKAEI